MLCFGDQNGIEPGTSRCGALGNCPIVAFARAGQSTSLKLLRDGTPSGTMVLFVCWSSEIPMLEIIDALCSYHEPTRRCLDRALTRWGNRRGACGNGSSMRSWVRVALSGGVLPAFLPAAGRKGGSFGKMGAHAVRVFHGEPRNAASGVVVQRSAGSRSPGRLFRRPSTVQPYPIFAAFRGDRASCGRLHAFEF